MPAKFIEIHHPKIEGTTVVSEASFERVWKEKGWRRGKSARSAPQQETGSTKEEKD